MYVAVLSIFAALLLTCYEASAASKYAAVEQRGFLAVENFTQWVTLGYRYTGRTSDTQKSTRNKYKEIYSLSTAGNIVDPRLVNFSLRTDLEARQEYYSSSATDSSNDTLSLQYQLNLLAFDTEVYPVLFTSYLQKTFISDAYRPSYDLTVSGNRITSWYYHTILPLRFDASHTVTTTSGLPDDKTYTNDNFALNATNNFRNRSYTNFDASYYSQTREGGSGEGKTKTNRLFLSNNLILDSSRKYSLNSSISASKSQQEGEPTNDYRWFEELNAQFGVALDGSLSYDYHKQENLTFDNNSQELVTHAVAGVLHHRLYQSLDTTLQGHYVESNYLYGTDDEIAAELLFKYEKTLPRVSFLNIDLGGGHQLNRRDVQSSQFDVRAEPHENVQQGETIPLNTSGFFTVVLSVRSLVPDILYVEGIDYLVNGALGTIEILFSGGIADGTDLEVAYSVQTDNSLEYTTDNFSIASTLRLYDGKYKILGRFSLRDRQLVSGESSSGIWGIDTTTTLGGEIHYPKQRYTLNYYDYDSPLSKFHFFEAGAFFNHAFRRSSVQASIKNRYTVYDAVDKNSKAYNVNNFDVGATYQRPIATWGTWLVSANYTNASGDYVSRKGISCRSTLQARFKKLLIDMAAASNYSESSSWSVREDTFTLTLTRYF